MTTWKARRTKGAQRLIDAKEAMDDAQATLDKAEDEYHLACKALDELDDEPFIDQQKRKET